MHQQQQQTLHGVLAAGEMRMPVGVKGKQEPQQLEQRVQAQELVESPRDVLEGPAWSDFQAEELGLGLGLEDLPLPSPAGRCRHPGFPSLLAMEPDPFGNCLDYSPSSFLDASHSPHMLHSHQQQPPQLLLPHEQFQQQQQQFQQQQHPQQQQNLEEQAVPEWASSRITIPHSFSVDLKGVKVNNREVLSQAVGALGVNKFLRLVEIWDKRRRLPDGGVSWDGPQQEAVQQQTPPLVPPWGSLMEDPLMVPFSSMEELEDSFGHLPALYDTGMLSLPLPEQNQQQQVRLRQQMEEEDGVFGMLNYPAKCPRLSSPPSSSDAGERALGKFVSPPSTFSPPLGSRVPSPSLPGAVSLEMLAPALLPHQVIPRELLQQQQQKEDVPSFVPVAQSGTALVTAFDDDLSAAIATRTRQQQQQQLVKSSSVSLPLASTPGSCSSGATTRAARKHRMEKQRHSHSHSFVHHHHLRGCSVSATASAPAASSTGNLFSSGTAPSSDTRSASHGGGGTSARHSARGSASADVGRSVHAKHSRSEDSLQFLFKKELKPSDVGSLGRIILPKREAESQLPPLNAKDGIPIHAEDYDTGKEWTLKYRYWPNNKSRMYVLECTGEFVKMNRLEEGDVMMLYRCYSATSKYETTYVLRGKKQNQGSDVIATADATSSESSSKSASEAGSRSRDSDPVRGPRSSSVLGKVPADSGKKRTAGAIEREPSVAVKAESAPPPEAPSVRARPEDEFLQDLPDDSSFEWGGLATLERFPSLETGDMSIEDILGFNDSAASRQKP